MNISNSDVPNSWQPSWNKEAVYRRQPLCRCHGRQDQCHVPLSRMAGGLDDRREYGRKIANTEDKEANKWALDYWGKRAMKPRAAEIFQKRFGYDPNPCLRTPASLRQFFSWPGGGGNLNYPKVYNEGLASMLEGC